MPDEKQINTNWDIIIIPQEDGTVISRHIGLSLEDAAAILKAVLADYEQTLLADPS